ncbi:MAG: hypothetical protein QM730_23870 [Anaerolineales bacterium]
MKSKDVVLAFIVALTILISSCIGDVNGVPEPREAIKSHVASGRRLIAMYGCGACHAIPGVPGANAMAAPPLKCFYQRSYIAGRLPNTKENLAKWIEHPQLIELGTAMPDLGVSKEDASNIADYLYEQPTYWGIQLPLERKCSP